MNIKFEKIKKKSAYLDPKRGFKESSLPIEVRVDPLTKQTCTILEFRFKMPEKPDLSKIIDKSSEKCPFCPAVIEKVTPKFLEELIPEGRINLGESWVVPNLMPYSEYSAVTIISKEHFIAMTDFTEKMLTNAFMASQIYLKRVSEYDQRSKYFFIDWNYMPLSGGGQVHPHLQVFAYDTPIGNQKSMLDASREYYDKYDNNFWNDLIREEIELKERYVGAVGKTHYIMCFAPRSWLCEVMVLFQDRESILDLSMNDFKDFSNGVTNVLRYFNDQNLYSFNLSLTSGSSGNGYPCVKARIIPRFTLSPVGTADSACARMLYDMLFCFRMPEDVCDEMKEYF